MVSKSLISNKMPYLAVLLLGYSLIHPSRDIRIVRRIQSEVDAMRSENARIREQFGATLDYIRNLDPSQFVAPSGTDGDVADAASSVRVASGCEYFRARGCDGFRRGTDWWLVGDVSPWGVVDAAYRGGFVADGARYTFYDDFGDSHIKGLDNVK